MKFEIGKCYQHSSGYQYYICGKAKSIGYGECLIGENGRDLKILKSKGLSPTNGWVTFTPVGTSDEHAENWYEIPYEKFFLNNYEPKDKKEKTMMERKLKLKRILGND